MRYILETIGLAALALLGLTIVCVGVVVLMDALDTAFGTMTATVSASVLLFGCVGFLVHAIRRS